MDSKLLLMKTGSEISLAETAGEPKNEENMSYGSASMLAPETMPVVSPGQAPKVEYLDMGKLSYITNSVIADLIRMVRSALKQGKELRFINVPATLKTIVKKMGLSDIIKCS
jgi:ABC-type transporter Mla MlaB component